MSKQRAQQKIDRAIQTIDGSIKTITQFLEELKMSQGLETGFCQQVNDKLFDQANAMIDLVGKVISGGQPAVFEIPSSSETPQGE